MPHKNSAMNVLVVAALLISGTQKVSNRVIQNSDSASAEAAEEPRPAALLQIELDEDNMQAAAFRLKVTAKTSVAVSRILSTMTPSGLLRQKIDAEDDNLCAANGAALSAGSSCIVQYELDVATDTEREQFSNGEAQLKVQLFADSENVDITNDVAVTRSESLLGEATVKVVFREALIVVGPQVCGGVSLPSKLAWWDGKEFSPVASSNQLTSEGSGVTSVDQVDNHIILEGQFQFLHPNDGRTCKNLAAYNMKTFIPSTPTSCDFGGLGYKFVPSSPGRHVGMATFRDMADPTKGHVPHHKIQWSTACGSKIVVKADDRLHIYDQLSGTSLEPFGFNKKLHVNDIKCDGRGDAVWIGGKSIPIQGRDVNLVKLYLNGTAVPFYGTLLSKEVSALLTHGDYVYGATAGNNGEVFVLRSASNGQPKKLVGGLKAHGDSFARIDVMVAVGSHILIVGGHFRELGGVPIHNIGSLTLSSGHTDVRQLIGGSCTGGRVKTMAVVKHLTSVEQV